MKVYLASVGFVYEGNDVVGVFSKKKKAEKFLEHKKFKDYDYRDVIEIVVDEENL
jgi:hypothetical protein